MPASTGTAPRAGRRPRRSPLANPGSRNLTAAQDPADDPAEHLTVTVSTPREVTLAEFDEYLRTVNNRDGVASLLREIAIDTSRKAAAEPVWPWAWTCDDS